MQVRRDAIQSLIKLVHIHPALMNDVMVYGLESYISRPNLTSSSSEDGTMARHQQRLLVLLTSSAAYADSADSDTKEAMIMRCLLLAHHPVIGKMQEDSDGSLLTSSFRWQRSAMLG
jgi:hypothetical protein